MPITARPGIHGEGEDRPIAGAATSIAAFVGWAPRGPATRAWPVSSWAEFDSHFGGLDPRSPLGYAVSHFFMNGGRQAYIVRLVAADTPTPRAPGPAPSPMLGATRAGAPGTVLHPGTASFHAALWAAARPKAGLHLLDRVDLFNLLCVPGETSPAVLSRLAQYCERRRAFLIADSDPAIDRFDRAQGYYSSGPGATIDGARHNAAIYFPWVRGPDPLDPDAPRLYPPCGFIAGMYAKTDADRGVWTAPAGRETDLAGATGAAVPLDDEQAGLLNALGVNCLRDLGASGPVIWGARTLGGPDGGGSPWKYVPVRRMALFLEESLYRGLQWAAFEPNDEPLWARIRLVVAAFLQGLFRDGAFRGTTPAQAYLVKCDSGTTTSTDRENGVVNVVVGFAPLEPAEFVIIQIAQMAGRSAS